MLCLQAARCCSPINRNNITSIGNSVFIIAGLLPALTGACPAISSPVTILHHKKASNDMSEDDNDWVPFLGVRQGWISWCCCVECRRGQLRNIVDWWAAQHCSFAVSEDGSRALTATCNQWLPAADDQCRYVNCTTDVINPHSAELPQCFAHCPEGYMSLQVQTATSNRAQWQERIHDRRHPPSSWVPLQIFTRMECVLCTVLLCGLLGTTLPLLLPNGPSN